MRMWIAMLALAMLGCTRVPEQQLGAYREAMTALRASGDAIYADARVTADLLATAMADTTAEQAAVERLILSAVDEPSSTRLSLPDHLPTVRVPVRGGLDKVDPFALRTAALDVVIRYNDLLVAVVAGGSPASISGQVTEVVTSLDTFGNALQQADAGIFSAQAGHLGRAIVDTASGGLPYVDVIAALLSIAEQEYRNRAFRASVQKTIPQMLVFIDLLREDIADLYGLNITLFEVQADTLVLRLKRLAYVAQLQALELDAAGWSDDTVRALVQRLVVVGTHLPEPEDAIDIMVAGFQQPSAGTATLTPDRTAALREAVIAVESAYADLAEHYRAGGALLATYAETLDAYELLVIAARERTVALGQALATDTSGELINWQDLKRLGRQVQAAYAAYRDAATRN